MPIDQAAQLEREIETLLAEWDQRSGPAGAYSYRELARAIMQINERFANFHD